MGRGAENKKVSFGATIQRLREGLTAGGGGGGAKFLGVHISLHTHYRYCLTHFRFFLDTFYQKM